MIRDRERLDRSQAHRVALDCVAAGIEAAAPATAVGAAVSLTDGTLRVAGETHDLADYDEVVVLGGGKAAAGVVSALEHVLGDRLTGGVVVTDTPVDTATVDVVEASHPVPDERGVAGARRVREAAAAAGERTLVLAVVTGGASALLPAPADGVALADLQATTDALLASGATIDEVNAVRRHVSALKGGQLAAAAAPATVVTLALSDVVGDDPAVIGSGPTVPDPTTFADALAVLGRYDLTVPDAVRNRLDAGASGEVAETPTPGDPVFDRTSYHVLASARTAIDAAAAAAQEADFDPLVLSSRVRGEAREAAKTVAAVAEEARATGDPVEPPAVVLSGGETTVTVRGDGSGGPNLEFALSAAVEFAAEDTDAVLACVDTDGRDGGTSVAGAVVDGETVDDVAAARDALARNDSLPFLADRDAVLDTGRTGTNVNDLRVLVLD